MAACLLMIRILVASILLFLFGSLAVCNALSFWMRICNKPYPSGFPVLGGMFGFIGLWLLPVPLVSHYAWSALVLDCGCLLYTVGASTYLAHDAYIHSKRLLVMQLEGEHENGTQSVLKLYRNGDCILTQTDMPPNWRELSMLGGWHEEAGTLVLEIANETTRSEMDINKAQYHCVTEADVGLLAAVSLKIVWKAA